MLIVHLIAQKERCEMSNFSIVRGGRDLRIARLVAQKDDVVLMEIVGRKCRTLAEAVVELRMQMKGVETLESLIEETLAKSDEELAESAAAAKTARDTEKAAKKVVSAEKKAKKLAAKAAK